MGNLLLCLPGKTRKRRPRFRAAAAPHRGKCIYPSRIAEALPKATR
jgi:hypothetical protein